MQGKWKPYPTSIPLTTKIPVLLLMSFVWIIAYVAVKSIKTPGHWFVYIEGLLIGMYEFDDTKSW